MVQETQLLADNGGDAEGRSPASARPSWSTWPSSAPDSPGCPRTDSAKLGATVAVFEAETIGWGASSRNGGMVLTGPSWAVNQLISMYGRERTQAHVRCVSGVNGLRRSN